MEAPAAPPAWSETYDGGSPAAEQAIFAQLAQDMLTIQDANRQAMALAHPTRTLHARMVAGVIEASLAIDADLPGDLIAGYFRPGALLPAALRLSNASGIPQHDGLPDMRGAALRVLVPDQPCHDLLMTSYPVSHARNARQFVEFAQLAMGDRATFPARLVAHFGEVEARHSLRRVSKPQRNNLCPAYERQRTSATTRIVMHLKSNDNF